MPVWRTIKFAWKEIAGIVFFAAVVATSLYQLYSGWAHHLIAMPWVRGRFANTATVADRPVEFAFSVAVFSIAAVGLSIAIWLTVVSLRVQLRYFRARETRPPLDEAVREQLDP
jgi:hypothetical protein